MTLESKTSITREAPFPRIGGIRGSRAFLGNTEGANRTGLRGSHVRRLLSLGILLCFLLVAAGANAQIVIPGSGIINTIAGNGNRGYSGNGGAATAAEFYLPYGLTVGGVGNVYIADTDNCVVREVAASTGTVTTVAGNHTCGYSGNGGPATSAELSYPSRVAVDSSGDIYIGDSGNNVVRKVTASTGIITTVAGDGVAGYSGNGGGATNAELDDPEGVALDSSGNIYIADYENNVIRKVTVSSGAISTVAGNGINGQSGDGGAATSAELSGPAGVAVDSSGNIYIAADGNNRIRKVTVSTGIITTVAGNGTGGYSGDGGAATSAELNYPEGVALDSSGNIYIADLYNYRIRKVTVSTGTITTVAGNGTLGYSGNGSAATSAELDTPSDVAVDSSANVYIDDEGNSVIRAVGH